MGQLSTAFLCEGTGPLGATHKAGGMSGLGGLLVVLEGNLDFLLPSRVKRLSHNAVLRHYRRYHLSLELARFFKASMFSIHSSFPLLTYPNEPGGNTTPRLQQVGGQASREVLLQKDLSCAVERKHEKMEEVKANPRRPRPSKKGRENREGYWKNGSSQVPVKMLVYRYHKMRPELIRFQGQQTFPLKSYIPLRAVPVPEVSGALPIPFETLNPKGWYRGHLWGKQLWYSVSSSVEGCPDLPRTALSTSIAGFGLFNSSHEQVVQGAGRCSPVGEAPEDVSHIAIGSAPA
ncbi:hypothetical protein Baya_14909 [Bagarius yarrelli]|uniref:Uncharacterized protein n=1 Tax=Bagarius yarrelli TaxID=175774 RepID=A0A556VAA6_BAGYA|nr:hypothetical protein Baya_14909 [Bagarius yarrelli]